MSRRIVSAIVIAGAIAATSGMAEASTSAPAGSKFINKTVSGLTSRFVKGFDQAVACLSTRLCVLVGTNLKYEGEVVAVRDGVPRHIGVLASTSSIYSVSCPGRAGCIALAGAALPNSVDVVTIGGLGRIDSSKVVDVPLGVTLDKIWCARLTSCVVVGTSGQIARPYIAAGTWNGRKLTLHKVVVPDRNSGALVQGLSCFGSSCDAVGFEDGSTTGLALTISHGRPGKLHMIAGTLLEGVSCVGPTRCYAAGITTPLNEGVVLTLSGGRPHSPHQAPPGVELLGIACGGGGCTAAGQDFAVSGPAVGALVRVFAGRPTSTSVVSQSGGYDGIARIHDFIAAVGPSRHSYTEVSTGS